MICRAADIGGSINKNMQIVKLTRDYVIINKPIGMPSQADPSNDPDALSTASLLLRKMGENSSLWLVHRLDRTVGGLLIFARGARAAAILSESLGTEDFVKEYLAVCEGNPVAGEYRDLIYKDSRISKAFIVDKKRTGVKEARLTLSPIESRDERTLVRVRLHTGRYHQIRVQLAHRKCPLVGDGKYGSRDKGARSPALFAYHLAFKYKGESYEYFASPDVTEYPWSMFAETIKREVEND